MQISKQNYRRTLIKGRTKHFHLVQTQKVEPPLAIHEQKYGELRLIHRLKS